ncbi:hypothetical protein [Vibrio sp. MEBiC08052]|uniref:hypothetical protein n=1 Tax=Vibrio sp. MEBiC08052 TaxID=1761910 RepID=UPI0007406371|nr:hypothetical protein [Vibrio sp. MEBiC08052]KUI97777.1 hypothetical protein VRK_33400 [Vibrio sp. MEBiC08052]
MNNINWIELVKTVAIEQGYEVEGSQIYLDKYNSVDFSLCENDSGYLQVHQWEYTNDEGEGRYGRAVYSLRNITDVIQFCNILISSSNIRAKRRT